MPFIEDEFAAMSGAVAPQLFVGTQLGPPLVNAPFVVRVAAEFALKVQ